MRMRADHRGVIERPLRARQIKEPRLGGTFACRSRDRETVHRYRGRREPEQRRRGESQPETTQRSHARAVERGDADVLAAAKVSAYVRRITDDMSVSAIDMCVFVFAFASAFLLAQKRPMLALSTRLLLAVLLGLALGYAASEGAWYRSYLGVATLVANALFIAFAAIDFHGWQKKRLEGG
jgi:hypothetical protein